MSADDFQSGLRDWLHGEDSLEAEAAGIVFAETVLLHRIWLQAHKKETR